MKAIADIGLHAEPKTKQAGCIFQPRQKPIAAFVASLKIPAKAPETAQGREVTTEPSETMTEVEETPQSAENSDWIAGVDFESAEQEPALPVFDDQPKREQARLVQTIGARLAEARELCNMSQSVAAQRLGYSNSSKLSKVEGATDTNSVPLWLIVRASKLYDVSIDFLFGTSDDWETGLRRPVQGWLLDTWQAARVRDLEALEKLHRRVGTISSLLPAVANEAERTAEAIERFAELNPEFEEMRGSARLAAAAENLIHHAAKANGAAQRFRVEIGADRSNPPTT